MISKSIGRNYLFGFLFNSSNSTEFSSTFCPKGLSWTSRSTSSGWREIVTRQNGIGCNMEIQVLPLMGMEATALCRLSSYPPQYIPSFQLLAQAKQIASALLVGAYPQSSSSFKVWEMHANLSYKFQHHKCPSWSLVWSILNYGLLSFLYNLNRINHNFKLKKWMEVSY